MNEYRMAHTAPDASNGQCITTLGVDDTIYGLDVLDQPELYGAEHQATTDTISSVRRHLDEGGVDLHVRVFRAVPPGVRTLNTGDWVSLSEDYAIQHSYSLMDGTKDDGSSDGDVISFLVHIEALYGQGDLEEWGYQGASLTEGECTLLRSGNKRVGSV